VRHYRLPHGWVRIGLLVRGKYAGPGGPAAADADRWLGPFNDSNPGLWHRAYHGTDRAGLLGIVGSGFRPSVRGKLGPGVYVTPHVEYAGDNYTATHAVRFSDGMTRTYRCVVMCAVRPGSIVREGIPGLPQSEFPGENSEWVVCDAAAVRPYGILVKEIDLTPVTGQPIQAQPAQPMVQPAAAPTANAQQASSGTSPARVSRHAAAAPGP
jgi:hypothetical protein